MSRISSKPNIYERISVPKELIGTSLFWRIKDLQQLRVDRQQVSHLAHERRSLALSREAFVKPLTIVFDTGSSKVLSPV